MSRVRALAVLCLLVVLVPPADAGKSKTSFMTRPGTIAMDSFSVVTPGGSCGSWALAAATESILALDDIKLDQHVLLQKAYGGELCDDRLDLQAVAKAVNGEYETGPKKGMKVVTRVFPAGAPLQEELISALQNKRPMIVIYKGHPYVAVAVEYDENIGPRGMRLWEAHTITLLDPTAADEEHRRILFDKAKDDVNDFTGAVQYVLFPTEQVDWVAPQ